MVGTSVSKMSFHIIPYLGAVQVGQFTLEINALPDSGIGLKLKLLPKISLTDEDKSHGTLRIHLEIEKESDLLQHLPVQKMCFIYDDNRLKMLDTPHKLDFSMQLTLGITTIKFGFTA
jgi:hypothetical protein